MSIGGLTMKLHLSNDIYKNVPKNILSELLKLVNLQESNKVFHFFKIIHKNKVIYSIEHTIPVLKRSYQLNFNKDENINSYPSFCIVIIIDEMDTYVVSLQEFKKINK